SRTIPAAPSRSRTRPKEPPVAAPARSASPRTAPASFEALFRARYRELYSLSWRLRGDAAEAEDVVQEVFWRLAGSTMLDRPDEEIAAWLRRVCINASHNRLRGQRRGAARPVCAARVGRRGPGAA